MFSSKCTVADDHEYQHLSTNDSISSGDIRNIKNNEYIKLSNKKKTGEGWGILKSKILYDNFTCTLSIFFIARLL